LVQASPSAGAAPAPTAADDSTDAENETESEEEDDATATPSQAGEGAFKPRQVPRDEAVAYAAEAGLLFAETSAKTGEGIVDVFTEIGPSGPPFGRGG
jgi:Ras-related protein Rab-5C